MSRQRTPRPHAAGPAVVRWRDGGMHAHRILVVDDDPGMRAILAEVLRASGYEIHVVDDGEAGWDALRSADFDLLISDHEMPRLTGADLLRRLRAGSLPRPDLPAILISGKLQWPDPELLGVLPPGVTLAKPFVWAELLAHIRTMLSHTTPRRRALADAPAARGWA